MNILAKANAVKLITKYCYDSPSELNLEELLYAEDLKLKEEPLQNCEGKILFDETMGIITVNSNINDNNQKRFTISHEMGHFYNEKEAEKHTKGEVYYSCGYNEFYGTNRNLEREASANDFAAELLMHELWFVEAVRGKKVEARMLKDVAEYFNVSLSAAAIRYAEIGTRECAVVMSKGGFVKWSCINKSFPHQFIKWGNKVSKLSYASDIFEGKPYPIDGEDVPAEAWFKGSYNLKKDERVNEFNIPMKNYNSVLTVLYY
jgi:Zn-dependent peptidase ImmA (M78 family)